MGEEFIRHAVASQIAAMIEFGRRSLLDSARFLFDQRLPHGTGGIIGIDARGNILCLCTARGMYRGWSDATGRFEVRIWE